MNHVEWSLSQTVHHGYGFIWSLAVGNNIQLSIIMGVSYYVAWFNLLINPAKNTVVYMYFEPYRI